MTVYPITRTDPRWALDRFRRGSHLHRRHLTTSQRAMIAARLTNLEHGQRADYAEGSLDTSAPVTLAEAAAALDVSPPSVERGTTTGTGGRPPRGQAGNQGHHPPPSTFRDGPTAGLPAPGPPARPPTPPPTPPPRRGARDQRNLPNPDARPHNFPRSPLSCARKISERRT